MFVCPVCRSENRPDARFCRTCGLERAEVEAPGALCGNCERSVRHSDRFCQDCGGALDSGSAPRTKTCPRCQSPLSLTARFCWQCGKDVRQIDAGRVAMSCELFGEENPDLLPKYEA